MTAQEIFADINSRPPYQKDEVAQHYIGTRVRFDGRFRLLMKQKNNKVIIVLTPNSEGALFPSVSFSININECPEFKFMRTETPLMVEGKIVAIRISELELDDVVYVLNSEGAKAI